MALPQFNKEYGELLSLFAKHRVRYLVVGAYAVIYHSEPRYTKDIDLWVDPSPDNALRTFRALVEFGAPLSKHTYKDFTDRYFMFQIGVEPVRVDVPMSRGRPVPDCLGAPPDSKGTGETGAFYVQGGPDPGEEGGGQAAD